MFFNKMTLKKTVNLDSKKTCYPNPVKNNEWLCQKIRYDTYTIRDENIYLQYALSRV